jgi:hypothetical protein
MNWARRAIEWHIPFLLFVASGAPARGEFTMPRDGAQAFKRLCHAFRTTHLPSRTETLNILAAGHSFYSSSG